MQVDSEGASIRVCPITGRAMLRVADVEVEMPFHPDVDHVNKNGDRCYVLDDCHADLVLEDMQLPDNADEGEIYCKHALCSESGAVFSYSAVWFTCPVADKVWKHSFRKAPEQGLRGDLADLFQSWKCIPSVCSSGGSQQPASGGYTPLGVGVLCGRGRGSVRFSFADSEGVEEPDMCSNVPYLLANWEKARELEPTLSRVMTSVACVGRLAWPDGAWEDDDAKVAVARGAGVSHVQAAYQFPGSLAGRPIIRSHQVVLRGPRGQGAGGLEEERACMYAVSDLHVDPWDGGTPATLYSCECEAGVESICKAARHALRWRDLAVLSGKGGGRGVRIRVMKPGWCCLVFVRTAEHLHGGVTKSREDGSSMVTPGLEEMRCVTYPLARVDCLLDRLAEQPSALPQLQAMSSPEMNSRFMQKLSEQ